MDFQTKISDVVNIKSDLLTVFVAGKSLLPCAKKVDQATQGALSQLVRKGDIGQSTGASAILHSPQGVESDRLLLMQLGANAKNKSAFVQQNKVIKAFKSIAARLTKPVKSLAVSFVGIDLVKHNNSEEWLAHHLALEIGRKLYVFDDYKSDAKKNSHLKKVILIHEDKKIARSLQKGAQAGCANALGVNLARQLGNLPGNICTPRYLAAEAKKLSRDYETIKVSVLGEKQMEKLGMHSLLSVSKGSVEEAQLITIEFRNGSKTAKPHVLVGKGITFDTGGISLKPGASMDEMKFDMCGAASVFGTIKALAEMNAKINVIGVIAAAENMPGGKASKPGDIVKSMSGQTIEILNTDAEGRLVLCDALSYVEKFKPQTVVDIATLTGACIIALGHHASAVYANKQELADALIQAGESSHDRAWQLPLWDVYQEQLKSNFADMANIGGRPAGSVTAACFLSRFAKNYNWAHLDIAGTAWHSGSNKGATGRPVSLLLNYFLHQ